MHSVFVVGQFIGEVGRVNRILISRRMAMISYANHKCYMINVGALTKVTFINALYSQVVE